MSGAGGKFRPRKHVNAVLAATSARHGALHVLEVMCRAMEFDRPEVTITRKQIEEQSRLTRNTVLAAYKVLKAEGTIVPVRNAEGGRGNATTYRLNPAGQGAKAAPQDAGQGDIWDQVCDRIARDDPATVQAWLGHVEYTGTRDGVMRLATPSRFAAEHCRTHLSDRVTAEARRLDPEIERVEFIAA